MKIEKIKVENFRSLKNFEIDLEETMSLIVGKNNTGKTSVIEILNKFINKSGSIESDDFNIDYVKELEKNIIDESYEFITQGIKMKIFIAYNEKDNLSNISNLLTTLDPENNYIIIDIEYILNEENFIKLKM